MTIADAINTGLLMAAVVSIALTFWQVRSGVRTQRAQFLKDRLPKEKNPRKPISQTFKATNIPFAAILKLYHATLKPFCATPTGFCVAPKRYTATSSTYIVGSWAYKAMSLT